VSRQDVFENDGAALHIAADCTDGPAVLVTAESIHTYYGMERGIAVRMLREAADRLEEG